MRKKYEVVVARHRIDYMCVEVQAKDEKRARIGAIAIAKHLAGNGEGEFCDGKVTRYSTTEVEVKDETTPKG